MAFSITRFEFSQKHLAELQSIVLQAVFGVIQLSLKEFESLLLI